MEKLLSFRRTWEKYITPCPYFNKENDPTKVMVGDVECYNCQFNKNYLQKQTINKVRCCYDNEDIE